MIPLKLPNSEASSAEGRNGEFSPPKKLDLVCSSQNDPEAEKVGTAAETALLILSALEAIDLVEHTIAKH